MIISYEEEKNIFKNLIKKIKLSCEKCGSSLRIEKNHNSYVLVCTWRNCKSKKSIWSKTKLENLRLKPEILIAFCRLWLEGYTRKQMLDLLNIDHRTYLKILRSLSRSISENYYSKAEKIGGRNTIVEVDESKFGKRKYNRGHHVDGVWVLGMVERTSQRKAIFLVINDRKAETLERIMKSFINPESIIYTDCWKGYSWVKNHFTMHMTVNHSISFINYETGVHTNTIEGTWNGIKMTIPIRYRNRRYLPLYLIRFMIKRNNKNNFLEELIKYLFL